MCHLFSTLLLLATLSTFAAPAIAALLIVPDHHPTIQSAIAAAASGDSIMVRPGVYAESLSLSGKDLTIFGESGAEATIISGSSSFRLLDATGPSVTVATVFEDLTFQDGKALKGAGIRLSGGASLTLRRCRFIHNRAVGNPGGAAGGAAVVGALSTLAVDTSLFQDNEAVDMELVGDGAGGAVYADPGSHLEIRNSEFVRNSASGFEGGPGGAVNANGAAIIEASRFTDNFGFQGGAIRGSEGSDIVVLGCLFDRNDAWTGAGIFCSYAAFTIENNTFIDNRAFFDLDAAIVAVGSWQGRARDGGAGGPVATQRIPSIEHNTVVFNICSGIGIRTDPIVVRNNVVTNNYYVGLISDLVPVPGSIACNDVWANQGGNYGGDCPDLTGIDGNISSDPLFCDPPARDFTLDAGSPCAPANSPEGCGLIGAWPVSCGVTAVNPPGAPSPPLQLLVRPNPVGKRAEFAFDEAKGPRVLEIVDGQGRLVAVLAASGRTALTWVPSPSIPAGVYFARLTGVAARSETVKIVVLR